MNHVSKTSLIPTKNDKNEYHHEAPRFLLATGSLKIRVRQAQNLKIKN
jgi:hypothetical protein